MSWDFGFSDDFRAGAKSGKEVELEMVIVFLEAMRVQPSFEDMKAFIVTQLKQKLHRPDTYHDTED
jgi:hypothetical protein